MLETLAPAGNREALDRAVAAGANAVYLGYAAFPPGPERGTSTPGSCGRRWPSRTCTMSASM